MGWSWAAACGAYRGGGISCRPPVYRLLTVLRMRRKHCSILAAVVAVPGAPAAPEVCHVLSTGCTVRYQLPADEGDAPVTGYQLQRRDAMSESEWQTVNEAPVADTELTVDRLQPLSSHRFRVAAENQHGVGEFSPPSEPVTCSADPDSEPQPSQR